MCRYVEQLKVGSSAWLMSGLLLAVGCGGGQQIVDAADTGSGKDSDSSQDAGASQERAFVRIEDGALTLGEEAIPFRLQGVTFSNYYWLDAEAFRSSSHHSPEAYEEVAGWGMNAVQLILTYRLLESDSAPFEYEEEGWRWLDENIAAAEAAGIYVVLDLLMVAGGDWHDLSLDTLDFDIWSDETLQDRFVALWQAIASRYADEPTVAAYSLLNEPVTDDGTGDAWQNLLKRTVSAIREVDDRHVLIADPLYGTNGTYTVPDDVDRRILLDDDQVLYDIHFYEPYEYTMQGAHWTGDDSAEAQQYPDESVVTVTGDLVHGGNTHENPVLPAGTSDWARYEGILYPVTDSDIVVSYPAVVCRGDNTGGSAFFDELDIIEYDENEEMLRTIASISITADSLSDWYPWSSDGTGELSSVEQGHADETALMVAGTLETGLFSTQSVLFGVSVGHRYQINGWMRGENISDAASCQLSLEFFSLGEGTTQTRRDAALLHAALDKDLSFGIENDVPMIVSEFGLMRSCFENDLGGEIWVQDMLDLLDERALSMFFFTYHSDAMGIYGDESQLPSAETVNTPLIRLLQEHLAE